MMRTKILLLLIAAVFVGMCFNVPTSDDTNRVTQDKLDKFEEEIIIKENEYQSDFKDISPTVVNSAGKKVESIIDKGFDFCFGFIQGMIDKNE